MSLLDPGLWCHAPPANFAGQGALFLDRDGVLVMDTNYLGRVEDMHMIDGAAVAVARCNAANIPVVLVTNQSGIGRGYYDWNGFAAVQAALSAALAEVGAHLDAVLACAYHGDGREPLRVADHPWRKPNSGMIVAAASRMKLDLPASWIIGDQPHDLAAGRAAGLAGGTLLAVNDRHGHAAPALGDAAFRVETAVNLAAAVASLLETGRLPSRVRS
jgi:D-glycero-D-manno-heptose 1,7-bisphosphate phosphatase